MPGLLDLPSEVLGSIPASSYSQVHAEDVVLAATQWRQGRCPIAALSRTCRKLHSIFNPILYQSLVLTAPPAAAREKLILTLTNHPELGEHLRTLGLDFYSAESLRNAEQTVRMVRDRLRTFFSHARNLKHLVTRCKTTEGLVLNFQELTCANIEVHPDGYDNTSQEMIRQLLLAPKLQGLTLAGNSVPDGQLLEDLKPATSNISELSIDIHTISAEMLQTILRVPRRLISFTFGGIWFNPDYQVIKYTDVETAISPHRSSLERVSILLPEDRFGVMVQYPVFGGFSFRQCSSLTWLRVSPEMFLGWKLCPDVGEYPFERPEDLPPETVREPITFEECLPDQIRFLSLVVEPYQRRRNGNDYMYDVLRGVIDADRLQNLESIYLEAYTGHGDSCFCALCFVSAMEPGQVPSILDAFRMDEIREMCEEAGIEFNIDKELLEVRENPPRLDSSSESSN